MKKLKTLLVVLLAFFTLGAFACSEDESYSVKFMDGTTTVSEVSKDKGVTLQPGDLPDGPAKIGYDFDGWYLDGDFSTEFTESVLSGDLTLYAKYTAKTYAIMFNVDGGNEISALSVTYNGAYTLPTPEKTGYTFKGWYLDGIEFPSTGTFDRTSAIRVTASWQIKKYEVTYMFGEDTLGTKEIEHGTKAPAWTETEDGYFVEGVYTDDELTNKIDNDTIITEPTTLYVNVQPKTFNIIVNEEGGNAVDTTAVFNSQYTVEIPEKEGHDFIGFTFADGTPFSASGTYTWTSNITVIAKWQRQADYQKTGVVYYNEGVEIESYTTQIDDGTAYNIPQGYVATKKGHTFAGWYTDSGLTTAYVNGTIINAEHDGDYDLHLYAKFTANQYKISYNLNGGNVGGSDVISDETVTFGESYTLKVPVKDGYSFEGYTYNETAFANEGTFEIDENITVVATWKSLVADSDQEGTELIINKGNYFKVRDSVEDEFTFVFLTGNTYNFNNHVLDLTKAGNNVQKESDSSFIAISVAEKFEITLTRNDANGSITYKRNAFIVESVNVLDFGADYQGSWMGSSSETFRSDFMDKKVAQNLKVGNVNFIPDIAIKNLGGNGINYKLANLKLTVMVDSEETHDYTVSDTGVIDFGDSLISKTATVSFVPVYNIYNLPALTFTVDINAGVNVYTDVELREKFRDLDVQQINILRNITATVSKGETVNGEGVYASNTYAEGSAFSRITSSTNDQITVNGNFFEIGTNAKPIYDSNNKQIGVESSLPTVNNDFSYRDWSCEATYYVANVQNGIFSYMNRTGATEGVRMHNGVLTINDLRISGNCVGDFSAVTSVNGKNNILINSGSYHGIIVRGGTANINNTTLTNVNDALFSDSELSANKLDGNSTQAVHWNVNGVKVENCFANSVYIYGVVKMDIKNSYFGRSSSSIINVDDVPVTDGTRVATEITVDENTTFNNFVTGEEAWFVAYGKAGVATALKGQVEPLLNSQGDTMLQDGKMNFIFFMRGAPSSETSEWNKDYNKIPYSKFTYANQSTMIYGLEVDTSLKQYDINAEVNEGAVTVATQLMALRVQIWPKQ